jgi:AraC-like DNA-binding protein
MYCIYLRKSRADLEAESHGEGETLKRHQDILLALAKKMNISKRQLSRILKQLFGTSFRQLLIDVRLNRAAQLLIETDASAEEIAAAVGYTSMSGFYSAFKDRFSISVGRYRKRFGKANT